MTQGAAVHGSVLDSVERPRLVRLRPNLVAVAFSLLKLHTARAVLSGARAEGLVGARTRIVETTSGTYGLALALACAEAAQPLTLVCDEAVDVAVIARMRDLGAEVEVVEQTGDAGGSQRRRLRRLEVLRSQHPDHYWPNQYDNPAHAQSYAWLGDLVVSAVGKVDAVVGATGSGASLCGVAGAFRQRLMIETTAVDTHGSVLFGQRDTSRVLRGIGNSVVPENLRHAEIDWVHWVSGPEAFLATRLLHRRHLLYMGPTSGAVFMVADHVARTDRDRTVVALFADEGHRYGTTVYDDAWLRQRNLLLDRLPDRPVEVSHPTDCSPSWSCMRWGARSLESVTGVSG